MTATDQTLLTLVRSAIADGLDIQTIHIPSEVDWNLLYRKGKVQSVGVIAVDGLERILTLYPDIELHYPEGRENLIQRRKWMSQSVVVERKYADHAKIMADLSALYSQNGIRMMVLKGYGASLNYPIPTHRPGGDIDTYHFGMFAEADELVHEKLGVEIDRSHHHHTVFRYNGVMVENHYDFINVHAHKDAPLIEAKLKELAACSTETVDILGEEIVLPCADFNAIFLMRHLGQHFAGERVILRQLLDWGLFMKKHSHEVDWETIGPFMKKIGLWDFCCVVNAICVEYLGISSDCFPEISENHDLVSRVMEDVLSPEFSEKEPKPFVKKWCFKARRWWANRWKHRLIYSDSLLGTAVTLALSHIRKPK